MKRSIKIFIGVLIFSVLMALATIVVRRGGPEVRAGLVAIPSDGAGFARVEGPRPFDFPADYGAHVEYQTEWWYYTGNLETSEGRHFGYQLTFFRRALVPPAQRQDRASNWAADHAYMAHFALTDVTGGRYQAFERFARGAAGLAGAEAYPYLVWLEDWSVAEEQPNVYRLHAAQGGLTVDLLLTDRKGPILHGEDGYSRKGPDLGNASYYYSQTRLDSSGTVQVGEVTYQVNGSSWMDHEWSTSALAADQVGWDWFALQLDDGSELMVFQIRRADDSVDPFSSGTLIEPDGSVRHLRLADFQIGVSGTWRSPRSAATYPARWTVEVPVADLRLEIEPYLADQELDISFVYWEGAVLVRGDRNGSPMSGDGYIELTGYASSMQGRF